MICRPNYRNAAGKALDAEQNLPIYRQNRYIYRPSDPNGQKKNPTDKNMKTLIALETYTNAELDWIVGSRGTARAVLAQLRPLVARGSALSPVLRSAVSRLFAMRSSKGDRIQKRESLGYVDSLLNSGNNVKISEIRIVF